MTSHITDNERRALQGIVDSDFQDGNEPVGNPVWSWSCNPFKSKRTFGGVVASLARKGLVLAPSGEGDDSTITLTKAGADALAAAVVS